MVADLVKMGLWRISTMMEVQDAHFQPDLATIRKIQSLIQHTGLTLYIERLSPVRDG